MHCGVAESRMHSERCRGTTQNHVQGYSVWICAIDLVLWPVLHAERVGASHCYAIARTGGVSCPAAVGSTLIANARPNESGASGIPLAAPPLAKPH